METVYLLFSTDAWHSKESRELIGVFSEREILDEYIYKMRRREKLSDDDIAMLNREDQTQGRDVNLLITNEILNPKYAAPKR